MAQPTLVHDVPDGDDRINFRTARAPPRPQGAAPARGQPRDECCLEERERRLRRSPRHRSEAPARAAHNSSSVWRSAIAATPARGPHRPKLSADGERRIAGVLHVRPRASAPTMCPICRSRALSSAEHDRTAAPANDDVHGASATCARPRLLGPPRDRTPTHSRRTGRRGSGSAGSRPRGQRATKDPRRTRSPALRGLVARLRGHLRGAHHVLLHGFLVVRVFSAVRRWRSGKSSVEVTPAARPRVVGTITAREGRGAGRAAVTSPFRAANDERPYAPRLRRHQQAPVKLVLEIPTDEERSKRRPPSRSGLRSRQDRSRSKHLDPATQRTVTLPCGRAPEEKDNAEYETGTRRGTAALFIPHSVLSPDSSFWLPPQFLRQRRPIRLDRLHARCAPSVRPQPPCPPCRRPVPHDRPCRLNLPDVRRELLLRPEVQYRNLYPVTDPRTPACNPTRTRPSCRASSLDEHDRRVVRHHEIRVPTVARVRAVVAPCSTTGASCTTARRAKSGVPGGARSSPCADLRRGSDAALGACRARSSRHRSRSPAVRAVRRAE